MSAPISRGLLFGFICGVSATLWGCSQWITGMVYRDAAEHEISTVGQIVNISEYGRHGPTYNYDFTVNGVRMRDYSGVCDTPLTRTSCIVGGPALVYYSFQPFSNSRLGDFTVVSRDAFQAGNRELVIGVSLIVLCTAIFDVQRRMNKDEPESDEDVNENSSAENPDDALSITPRD